MRRSLFASPGLRRNWNNDCRRFDSCHARSKNWSSSFLTPFYATLNRAKNRAAHSRTTSNALANDQRTTGATTGNCPSPFRRMPFTVPSAFRIFCEQTKPPALVFPKPEPKRKPGRNAAAVNVERSRARGRVASNTLTALGGGSGQLTPRRLPIHGSSSHWNTRHSIATVMMRSSANSLSRASG